MSFADFLPQKFVASNFVTKQRLAYEASPTRRKIVDGSAYVTGAAIGAACCYVIYKAGQKSVQN